MRALEQPIAMDYVNWRRYLHYTGGELRGGAAALAEIGPQASSGLPLSVHLIRVADVKHSFVLILFIIKGFSMSEDIADPTKRMQDSLFLYYY